MDVLAKISGLVLKVGILNVCVAVFAIFTFRSNPPAFSAAVAWVFVGLTGLLDVVWLGILAYAAVRTARD
jgi:hypothetical protein